MVSAAPWCWNTDLSFGIHSNNLAFIPKQMVMICCCDSLKTSIKASCLMLVYLGLDSEFRGKHRFMSNQPNTVNFRDLVD